ncbi:MAG: Spy/CpxP family protein refolding chaperone [Akkermansiaceae bacterium]
MRRSRLILLVILSAAISAGLTTWATRQWLPQPTAEIAPQKDSKKKHDFHDWLHEHFAFTPDQQSKLAPVEAQFDDEREKLQKQLAKVSGKLAHALGDPSLDAVELQPLIAERHRLQIELQELLMAHLLEKRALLTPEQQKQYQEWIHESIAHDHGS